MGFKPTTFELQVNCSTLLHYTSVCFGKTIILQVALVEYEMVIADHLLSNGLRACGVIVKYTNLSVFNQEGRRRWLPARLFFAVKYDYEWLRKLRFFF